jgi:hypothetical protein
MDKILPSQEFACAAGLPSFPHPLERLVKTLLDMPIGMLSEDELDLLDCWVAARSQPIREAGLKHGTSRAAIADELGWRR